MFIPLHSIFPNRPGLPTLSFDLRKSYPHFLLIRFLSLGFPPSLAVLFQRLLFLSSGHGALQNTHKNLRLSFQLLLLSLLVIVTFSYFLSFCLHFSFLILPFFSFVRNPHPPLSISVHLRTTTVTAAVSAVSRLLRRWPLRFLRPQTGRDKPYTSVTARVLTPDVLAKVGERRAEVCPDTQGQSGPALRTHTHSQTHTLSWQLTMDAGSGRARPGRGLGRAENP